MVLDKESITKIVYFIKRTFFEGEQNVIIELVSLTKEYTQNVNGKAIVSPEILASSLREVTLDDSSNLNALESKIFITEEEALELSHLEDKQDEFLEIVGKII